MKQEKPKKQVYTRAFHLLVLKDYYESGSSIGAIVRKYGLVTEKEPSLISSIHKVNDKKERK